MRLAGFDLVKVETNTPTELSALLRQRSYPSICRRLTMSRESANRLPLTKFIYLPVPVSQPKAFAALNAFADRLTAADKFSGVIAIAQHGKQVFAKAWGLADRASRKPVTLGTRFLFASQGKMFTAVAVLALIERGQLGFDDPVDRYLTDYPNAEVGRTVTIRELLTHMDGLGDINLLQPKFAQNRAAVTASATSSSSMRRVHLLSSRVANSNTITTAMFYSLLSFRRSARRAIIATSQLIFFSLPV